ncbi:MAG: trehalose-phosphatase [Burkholderiaceae bacterium]
MQQALKAVLFDTDDALTVQALPGTSRLAGALRQAGIRIALISPNRSAHEVLHKAGGLDLFDTWVDAGDLARLHLPGEPDPAVLLEAAARLAASPAQCAVIGDAIAGVQAGARGGFGCVIGVDRGEHGAALLEAGAHLVIHDLSELSLDSNRRLNVKTLANLPSVWDRETQLRERLAGQELVVFLDYDGTLTPIVQDHTQAFLAPQMREAVHALSEVCTVAIVSGRDLAMLQSLVQLDSVFYAGSHGFEIAGPAGSRHRLDKGVEFLAELDQAQQALRERLAGIEGHAVERKRFSLAVHFRQVADGDLGKLQARVDSVLAEHPRLKRGHGKKVFELQPDIDWNKGQAVRWLLERLAAKRGASVPIYIGDDITDEHAFHALAGRGVCVAVRDGGMRQTAAELALADVDDVKRFVDMLSAIASRRAPGSQGRRIAADPGSA